MWFNPQTFKLSNLETLETTTHGGWIMKKLVTAFAACMIAGFVSAQVESLNIVGYNTMAPGDSIIPVGVSLKNMAGTNQDYVVSGPQLFGHTCVDGDAVLVLNANDGAFDTYYISGGNWYFISNQGGDDVPVAAFIIPYGGTVYLVVAAPTVTIAGEVAALGTQQVVFDPSTNPLSLWPLVNPYPIDTKLSDLASFALDGDAVLILNALDGAFDTYYISGGNWYFISNQGGDDVPVAGTTVILPAGVGGYFVANGGSTRTWTVTL